MWTDVQITELKKSWVSNAEKMEFVLEMRAKTKGLRYTRYILKVCGKFMLYHPFAFAVWDKLHHLPKQNLRGLEGFIIVSWRCREGMDQHDTSSTASCDSGGSRKAGAGDGAVIFPSLTMLTVEIAPVVE